MTLLTYIFLQALRSFLLWMFVGYALATALLMLKVSHQEALPLALVLQVATLNLPWYFTKMLPLIGAVVLGSVYKRLGKSGELTILQAAGLSPYRVLLPGLFMTFLVVLLGGGAILIGAPHARLLAKERVSTFLFRRPLILPKGRFFSRKGFVLFVGDKGKDGTLKSLFLFGIKKKEDYVMTARRGLYFPGEPIWYLEKGSTYKRRADQTTSWTRFDRAKVQGTLFQDSHRVSRDLHPFDRSLHQLLFPGKTSYQERSIKAELHERLSRIVLIASMMIFAMWRACTTPFSRHDQNFYGMRSLGMIVGTFVGYTFLLYRLIQAPVLIPWLYVVAVFPFFLVLVFIFPYTKHRRL